MDHFIPYGKQWIDEDDIDAVVDVLKSDFLTQGPKVEEFENTICDYTNAKYSVAVANGTAALHLAVAALNIDKSKEGITSPNSFIASANCFVYNGLKPVFVDIDDRTYNIDSTKVEKKLTKDTRVIIPVHFAGQPAEMEKINIIARKNNIFIIEDAAHAIGSRYSDGSKVGNCKYSDMTIFSFHPVKTITTGEGGVVTTNDKDLYKRLLLLRTHGITKDADKITENPGPWYYEMQELGFNYRLTDIQAVLGISQLKKLDQFIIRRREIVQQYNEAFQNIKWLITPYEKEGVYSAFHLYVLLVNFERINKSRKEVMDELRKNNIGTQVHYIPTHTQPYYINEFGYKIGDYPITEKYYNKALSLPLYPKMTDENVEYVINTVISIGE